MLKLWVLVSIVLMFSACHNRIIQQGNVLKTSKLAQIKVGDSKFQVETLMGSPAMNDPLHPRHVYYIEQYENQETDVAFIRRIEINYDKSLRVTNIHRFNIEKKEHEDG
ncbi:MAG: outer membrane protein assembly factor BamE [Mariprofundaceae bacterium]|nr:outer membrane protein assembly factor BamE [Mariprofundaceae bacterium]